jgi:predicted Zn finger-like uncharacterized protein
MPVASCPSCGHQFRVQSDREDRRIKCPDCRHSFTADDPDDDRPSRRRSRSADDDRDEAPKKQPMKAGPVIALCAGVVLVVLFAVCLGVGLMVKKGRENSAATVYASDPSGHIPEWKKMQAEQERERQAEQERMRKIRDDNIAGRGNGQGKTTSTSKIKSNRNLPREEFRTLVIGLTPAELQEAIGTPDRTQDDEDGDYWYYDNVAVDPFTGKKSQVQIIWKNNRVKTVNFY